MDNQLDTSSNSVNPKVFNIWLLMGSIFMIFGSYCSYYLVKLAEPGTLRIQLPVSFLINTVIIVLSSVTAQLAVITANKNKISELKILVLTTVLLGVSFLIMQFIAWGDLVDMNVYFSSNHSEGSMIYVFSGVHGIHLVSGLVFLGIMLLKTFKNQVHSNKMTWLKMSVTYWHFLGILWVFIYLFILLNNS